MSIEHNRQLTDDEVSRSIEAMEQQLAQPNRGEQIASLVDNITIKHVPASLESAEETARLLSDADAAVRNDIEADPNLKDEIGEDYINDLHKTAEKGIDNWRLTQEERAEWAETAGSTRNRLSHKMRSLMDTLSPEDSQETEIQKFARLQKQAHDRLVLDDAIRAKYDVEPTAAKSRRVTRPAGASPYATGDGMISVTETAAVVPAGVVRSGTGAEGKSRRATRPVTTITPTETTASNEVVTDEPVKEPKKAKKLVRPAEYPKDDWKLRSKKEKKLIIEAEALAADQKVSPEDRKGGRESLRNLGYTAVAAATIGMTRIGEYFRDREQGKRRRTTGAIIAGAAAVIGAGVAYASMKNGMSAPSGNHLLEFAQNKPHDVAGKQAALQELQAHAGHPAKAAEHAGKVSQHLTESLPAYNARTGAGTIDHVVAEQAHKLGYHISEKQHHILTQHTLNLNHLSWDDARHLPVGYEVHTLTPEEIEKVLSAKS